MESRTSRAALLLLITGETATILIHLSANAMEDELNKEDQRARAAMHHDVPTSGEHYGHSTTHPTTIPTHPPPTHLPTDLDPTAAPGTSRRLLQHMAFPADIY